MKDVALGTAVAWIEAPGRQAARRYGGSRRDRNATGRGGFGAAVRCVLRRGAMIALAAWGAAVCLHGAPKAALADPPGPGPIKVFILAGQSNMEGKASLKLLEYQIRQPGTRPLFEHLQKDGKWVVRDDVWIKYLDRKGRLTVGFGSPNCFGPELEFGNVMGDYFKEPVLLIKTAWGGKSLYRDFRPPSSGLPPEEELKEMLQRARRRNPDATLDDIKQSFGHYYRLMLQEVRETLQRCDELFPELRGRDYEIAGFVWFQGWNDMINPKYVAEYAKHMANFIRDVRRDLNAPNLPFVIGQLGVGGTKEDKPNPRKEAFKKAQASVAELPEFRGNVAVVRTDQYWDEEADAVFKKGWRKHRDEWEKVGSNFPYHYLGSCKTFLLIGRGFGEAMIRLIESRRGRSK